MNEYMMIAIKEAEKAFKKKEVPVGAVIVKNNKVITKAHNKRIRNKEVISHAEIIAIVKANKKVKDWRLNDCDLYVTLEPCDMCMHVIKETRIRNVYFLLKNLDNKKQYSKTTIEQMFGKDNKHLKEYKEKLNLFFTNKR